MLIREEEAPSKLCPLAVLAGQTCVGSACMAWRLAQQHASQGFFRFHGSLPPGVVPTRPLNVPDSYEWVELPRDISGWREPKGQWEARRLGYCGLAGEPK